MTAYWPSFLFPKKNKKMRTDAEKHEKDPYPLETLVDYVYEEYEDDMEGMYATRKGLVRDLKRNIRLLERVLKQKDRAKIRM